MIADGGKVADGVLVISDKKFCSRLFKVLLSIEIFILFADIFLNHFEILPFGPLRRFFNLTREDSLSNWFQSMQLMLVGLSVWFIVFAHRNYKNKPEKIRFYSWCVIACFFTYMGLDDGTKLHERLGSSFQQLTSTTSLGEWVNAFPTFHWQLILMPIFAPLGFFIMWFLYKELKTSSEKRTIFFALCFYAMAVGLDFIEGLKEDPYQGMAKAFMSITADDIRHISKAIEETLEAIGSTFFLITFLQHLRTEIHVFKTARR
jgi:hypothetical protein